MDCLLLEYRLKKKGISRIDLLEMMGWSDPTRQTRMIAGEGWKVDELKILLQAGFSFEEIRDIFFSSHGSK